MTLPLSEIVGFVVDPLNFIALIALVGVLSLLAGAPRFGGGLLIVQGVVLIVFAALPVGQWLLHPLEERFPPPRAFPADLAGIVVLGGALEREIASSRGSLEVSAAGERILAMAALARENPDLPIVLTGRSSELLDAGGPDEEAALRRLNALGLGPERVIIEGTSRNTWEDAVFTRQLLGERASGRWLLVTSAWHMPRAVGVFRKAGWDVIAYPVDYRSPRRLEVVSAPEGTNALFDAMVGIKEWVGLASYRALDRTAVIFPAPDGG